MQKVKDWLAAHHCRLTVSSAKRNEALFQEGERCQVHLCSGGTYEIRLATLLHECGHVIVWLRRRRDKTKRVYGSSYREWMGAKGRCRGRTRRAELATLQEEMAAWDLGERLARRLKVRVSAAKFERVRARALLTYLPLP